MLKIPNRIGRVLDTLIKITEELEKEERKTEMISVIHELSIVHQNVLKDIVKK